MLIDGSNGTIELRGENLRIRRKGLANIITQGLQGERVIPLSSIRAVQFKEAGRWMAGYIQFSVVGSIDRPGGIMEATKDENAVLFERVQQSGFEQLRKIVETQISSPKPAPANPTSAGEELERLASLLGRGLLSPDEFNELKRNLIAR